MFKRHLLGCCMYNEVLYMGAQTKQCTASLGRAITSAHRNGEAMDKHPMRRTLLVSKHYLPVPGHNHTVPFTDLFNSEAL